MGRFTKTIAIDPTQSGFAFAVFSGREKIIDMGFVASRGKSIDKLERLVMQYKPKYLVLETPLDPRRSSWARKIQDQARDLAQSTGVVVVGVSRSDIRVYFGPHNRHVIAHGLSERFDALNGLLPKKKKLWETQHRHMHLFDAVSLAVTALSKISKGKK